MRLSLARDSAPSSQDAASCSSGVFRVASSSVAFSFAACQPNEWAVSHIGFGISALIVCPSYKPRGQTVESGPFLRHGVQRTGHMILVEVCKAVWKCPGPLEPWRACWKRTELDQPTPSVRGSAKQRGRTGGFAWQCAQLWPKPNQNHRMSKYRGPIRRWWPVNRLLLSVYWTICKIVSHVYQSITLMMFAVSIISAIKVDTPLYWKIVFVTHIFTNKGNLK